MKSLQKAGSFLIIAVMLTVLLPATALAGVPTGTNSVFSELTDLTSSNPKVNYAQTDPVPTTPYKATLSPSSPLFVIPYGITVEKVHYDKSAGVPPYPVYVSYIYKEDVDYTYDDNTGEIVIPVETLQQITYDGSPYHIRITAYGSYDGPGYVSVGAAVLSRLIELASTNPTLLYSKLSLAPYTATLSAAPGHSLPPSITVQWIAPDTTAGQPPYPIIVRKTYVSGTDYTYNSTTGLINIPVATLDDVLDPDPAETILITASGVANPATTYTITVTQGANGTISPASATNLLQGSNLTFSITPDSGFQIANVLVDDISVGAVNSYTFTNIVSNHTITASFEKKSATATPSPSPSPSATPTATPSPSGTPSQSDVSLNDDIPKTGDNSLSWVWWLLCVVSVVSITMQRRNAARIYY